MSFAHIASLRSIHDMNPVDVGTLARAIIGRKYSPDAFYREFCYHKLILKELIIEYINCCNALYDDGNYEEHDQCAAALGTLWDVMGYLNAEIPNTEREEMDPAFA